MTEPTALQVKTAELVGKPPLGNMWLADTIPAAVALFDKAIRAFEAGDKTALERFKVVEPVDPMLKEARALATIASPFDRADLMKGVWDDHYSVRLALASLNRGAQIERERAGRG